MPIKLIAIPCRHSVLPCDSSHPFSVSVEPELNATNDTAAKSERCYLRIQSAVDKQLRRLAVLGIAASLLAPPAAGAMGLPRLPKVPDFSTLMVPRQIVQPPPEKPVLTEKKTETLRTVRLVILGSVACTGLLVLVRLRTRQPVGSGDEFVRRTPVPRILPSRRQGRVLQLDPPARHAPETRR